MTVLLATGMIFFGAASANAYFVSMTSDYVNGTELVNGDTVTVTVTLDTEGESDIQLLSVSVLFNADIFDYNFSSPTYMFFVPVGRGFNILAPVAANNGNLRVGTDNQILLDWQNSDALPSGNLGSGVATMATIEFTVINGGGDAAFTLSGDSPGNVFQLGPANGNEVLTPIDTTGSFVAQTVSNCADDIDRVSTDLNCDGRSDLLFFVSDGISNGVMRSVIMNGVAADAAAYSGITFPAEQVVGTAHANSDTYSDVVTQYTDSGIVSVRSMATTGLATEPGSIRFFGMGADGANWQYMGAGDADNDGIEDLYFVYGGGASDPLTGLVRVILVQDATHGYAHPGFLPDECTPVGVADIDADGLGDVACAMADGLVHALLMDASGASPVFDPAATFLVNLATLSMNASPPVFALGNYGLVDLDLFDANGGADLVLEKAIAPTAGLVGLVMNSGTATGGVFIPASAVPNYTVLQNPGYELGAVGNYDGINQSDLASRYMAAATGNVVQIFLEAPDGYTRYEQGWPVTLPENYHLVD